MNKRRLWPRLLLAFGSACLTLLGLEVAYRVKLLLMVGDLPLGMSATYVVANDSESVPDDVLGYDLAPNKHTVSVRITDGRPALYYERFSNERGNYGPPKPHYEEAELKIAVFGDSYTAVGGLSVWPTKLEKLLQDRLGRSTCVLNFARDGYGVLQIFDMAKLRVPEFHPDLVLICFISDDLNRARLPATRPDVDVQTSFSDPSVTKTWCESVLQSQDINDPLLRQLNQDFERSKAKATPINYFTLSSSFLYNRLVWEDPFFHRPEKALNPRITFSDFAEDQQFVDAVSELEQAKIPYHLIHLPDHREMQAGKYILNRQRKKLRASLARVTKRKVMGLFPYTGKANLHEDLFLLPHDPHPSDGGLESYASAVDQLLSDLGIK